MTISSFSQGKKTRKAQPLTEICLQNHSVPGRVIDLSIKIFFEINFYFVNRLHFRTYWWFSNYYCCRSAKYLS